MLSKLLEGGFLSGRKTYLAAAGVAISAVIAYLVGDAGLMKFEAQWIRDHLNYDQLILEFHHPAEPASGWVHVSLKEADNRQRELTINKDGVFPGLLEA